MRIAVLTCLWRRPAITHVFWEAARYLRDWWSPHEVLFVAAGSEPLQDVRPIDALYVDLPNEPLGRKWAVALLAARTLDPDALFVLASDDLIDERVAGAYRESIEQGRCAGLLDFSFYRVADRQLGYWAGYTDQLRTGEPAGSGRLFSREVLEKLNWTLWDHEARRGLDGHAYRRMLHGGVRFDDIHSSRAVGGLAVALKGKEHIWGYERISPMQPDTPGTLERLPAEIQGAIRALPEDA